VNVTVRLFAGLREQAGYGRRELELPAGARVADVWAALGLGFQPAGLLYARNRSYVERDAALDEGDEVALIPPVSGGDGPFLLVERAIDLAQVVAAVESPEAGAVASFLGTVRAHSRGRTVLYLEYEGYDGMAEKCMAEIAEGLHGRHPLCSVAITHRLGRVEIGEASVAIAVSSPHRGAALAACQEAIDALKFTVPLWKKEVYEGGEEWIGKGS
jgi:molybdopterin synthase catalytic subunit